MDLIANVAPFDIERELAPFLYSERKKKKMNELDELLELLGKKVKP